ncbi:MAG TPA: YfhO family protein, partial [Thermoanaerobaculia bacterium]|nr:YfhO family protein [Thermoanaerobaculia bacterium]
GGILAWALFPHSTAAAWAPWVVAGALTVMRAPRPAAMVALALSTAALLLSGQPEVAAGAVVLAAFAGMWLRRRPARRRVRASAAQPVSPGSHARTLEVAASSRRRTSDWRRGLLAATLAGAIGVALAAPVLVPFALAARGSLRAGERLAGGPPAVAARNGAKGWFVEDGWRILRGPLSPLVYGEPYGPRFGGAWSWPIALSAYTGLVALAGGAPALIGRRRRIAAPFLIAWAAALVAASRFVPLERLLHLVPPLRVPELSRLLPLGCLGLAVAAALGCEKLRRGTRRRAGAAAATLAVLPALVLTPELRVAVIALGSAVGSRLLALRRARIGFAVLAAALLVDLVPWGRPQLPASDPGSFYPRTPMLDLVARETEGGRWRAVAEEYLVYPSLLTVYDVPELRPHNPVASREQLAVLARAFRFAPGVAQRNYFATFLDVEQPLLDFLNVRVVLSNPYLGVKRRLVRIAGPGPRAFEVYRNPAALPRWFLATAAEALPRAHVLDTIASMTDARRVALIAEETRRWLPAPREWDAAAVQTIAAEPGDLKLRIGGEGERLLATSLPGPRGWRARSGGRVLQTLSVNAAFLGVRVPAGVDRVELRYRPPGLAVGVALAAVAAVSLLAIATSGVIAHWRRRAPATSRG